MSHDPKVSVCIPSYNHARFLSAAIESVLGQTYDDFEIIIVDDGSSDGSLQIAESYAARHPAKVRLLTHPGHRNMGISETVNLAYRESRGVYWSGLPSDDVLCSDKLERQVAFLDSHPRVGWVYSYAEFINEEGRPMPERGLFGVDITGEAHPLQYLIERNVIPGMTVLARRSCTERVGLHEPALIYSDWEFWLRMLAQCEVAFLDRPLVKCRLHGYNTSGDLVEERENVRRALAVMSSIRRKSEAIGGALAESRSRALLDLRIAYYSFRLGDEAEARESLRAAFDNDPALGEDPSFFARWLRERVFELYHVLPHGSPEREFARWVCCHLPPVGNGLARRAAAAQFAEAALGERRPNARVGWRNAFNCFLKDPVWLADGSMRLIFLEGLLGARLVEMMRRGKSAIYKHG